MNYILLTNEQAGTNGLENAVRFQPLLLRSGANKGKYVCDVKCADVFPKIIGKTPTIINVDAKEFQDNFEIIKYTVEYTDKDGKKDSVEVTDVYEIKEKIREKEETKPKK